MTNPFTYPSSPHIRRHGPMGYANHASYRPWLRDEFSFRCVYCLLREQWGRLRGVFDIDHFLPIGIQPNPVNEYDNLVYACTTCNLTKQALVIPDPLAVLINSNVHLSEDGTIKADTPEAACLIESMGLDSEELVEFRMTWIGIIALAARCDPELHLRLMGFPSDLPDLKKLMPPGGNSRPEGVEESYHERKERGELPNFY